MDKNVSKNANGNATADVDKYSYSTLFVDQLMKIIRRRRRFTAKYIYPQNRFSREMFSAALNFRTVLVARSPILPIFTSRRRELNLDPQSDFCRSH